MDSPTEKPSVELIEANLSHGVEQYNKAFQAYNRALAPAPVGGGFIGDPSGNGRRIEVLAATVGLQHAHVNLLTNLINVLLHFADMPEDIRKLAFTTASRIAR